jgi:hypothetical protein
VISFVGTFVDCLHSQAGMAKWQLSVPEQPRVGNQLQLGQGFSNCETSEHFVSSFKHLEF